MEKLKNLKLFLLDMDGTIYIDNDLFDGVLEFLDYIKEIGGKYIFMTNNSSKGVDKYIEKLKSLGIESTKEDFVTSVDATIAYLKNKNYKKIYASGTKSFKDQLRQADLPIVEDVEEGIDCVLTGFNTELKFKDLEDICIILREDVAYVATNPDWVCPTWYGYVPDCGSVAQMIFNATKKMPYFIGKPQPDMANLSMEKTGFTKEQTAVIGDRLYTDIACGVNAGITSIFVLSGEGTEDDIKTSEAKPTFVFKNVKEILNTIKG